MVSNCFWYPKCSCWNEKSGNSKVAFLVSCDFATLLSFSVYVASCVEFDMTRLCNLAVYGRFGRLVMRPSVSADLIFWILSPPCRSLITITANIVPNWESSCFNSYPIFHRSRLSADALKLEEQTSNEDHHLKLLRQYGASEAL